MNVLAVVRLYPPGGGAGAEWYLHEVLVALTKAGHRCYVLAAENPGADVLDGVTLMPCPDPDVILTQIDGTLRGKALADSRGVPLVHFAHHARQFGHNPALQVANSEHVARHGERYGPVLLCRPHTPACRYAGSRGDWITLLNRSAAKGARAFYQLARDHSERRFVAVTGAWDAQVPAPPLPNLRIVDNQPDVNWILNETRILYAGSMDESWGRAPIEAAHHGIPSLVTPCPGYQEGIGHAGLYHTFGDAECAGQLIDCLDDPDEYQAHSEQAKQRAHALELTTRDDLHHLVGAIEDAVE